jgi:hypothetical protein
MIWSHKRDLRGRKTKSELQIGSQRMSGTGISSAANREKSVLGKKEKWLEMISSLIRISKAMFSTSIPAHLNSYPSKSRVQCIPWLKFWGHAEWWRRFVSICLFNVLKSHAKKNIDQFVAVITKLSFLNITISQTVN